MKKLIVLFLSAVMALPALAGTATFTTLSYTASILPNPDRGGLSDTGYDDIIDNWQNHAPVDAGISAGKRLGYCMVNIGAYRTQLIPQAFFDTLQSRLDYMRSVGMGCVMMPYYDYTGSSNDTTIGWAVQHVQQLGDFYKLNADVIKFIKPGLAGQYGEWHDSDNCLTSVNLINGCSLGTAQANEETLRDAMRTYFPKTIPIQWRYPGQTTRWYGTTPLTASQAYQASDLAHAGVANDCMLSGNPGGTTGDTGTWWQFTGAPLNTTGQQSWADTQTRYVPYGGEMSNNCVAPLRTTCAEARADFSRWHLTWLKNSGGDSTIRSGWSSGGCTNEMENLQGYRIQYDSITTPASAARDSSFEATLSLRNVGWAVSHYPRRVHLVFRNGASSFTCVSTATIRDLPPQASSSSTLSFPCTVPAGFPTGTAVAWLKIPDIWTTTASINNFTTRPANSDDAGSGQAWNSSTAEFSAGNSANVTIN